MPTAQTKASAKYNAKAYEEIKLRVKKGEKEYYKQTAEKLGLSVNQLFLKAVEEYLKSE